MKHHIILKFLLLLASLAIACAHFVHHVPPPKPVSGISVTYDPAGIFVTTTTIPVHIGSTTYSMILSTPSSGVQIALVSANAAGQAFLNNGIFIFQILTVPPGSSTTISRNTIPGIADWTNPWSIDLSSLITSSGTYPFSILMAVNGQTGNVTGTINVP